MDDFISREAATAYAPLPKHLREYQTMNLDDAWDDGYDFAIGQIESIPAADVRPVVPGEWIEKKLPTADPRDYFCRMALCCSICGHEIDYGRGYGPNFCGNCGADMRGEKR